MSQPLSSLSPVVYFMEGRDSMQLIYRWTKSLDPSLKRGFWTPEEDAVSLSPRENYSGSLPGYPKYNCVPFLSSG